MFHHARREGFYRLLAALLASCSAKTGPVHGTEAIDSLETIRDAMEKKDAKFEQSALYGDAFIYVFSVGETYYRVIAEAYSDIADAIWTMDRTTEDFPQRMNELAASLPIVIRENLSDSALTEEDLAKLPGRSGSELLDNGWRCKEFNQKDLTAAMVFGPFEYTVRFVEDEIAEDFQEEDLRHLTIEEVSGPVLGNATDLTPN